MLQTETHSHDHPVRGGLVTCQNCDHQFTGQYCNECGQRADTHPINWHYIWHEIPHSVWHVDRGILFTLRELLTRPGYTIREFLAGKRVNHYRPLALLLLLSAITLGAQHWLGVNFIESSNEAFGNNRADASVGLKTIQANMNHFIEQNQTLISLVQIPIFAFFYWRMFRKRGYNYPELLVAQTFITCFNLFASLFTTLLFWLLGGSAAAFSYIMVLSMLVMLAYTTFTYRQLIGSKMSWINVILRSVVAYLLSYLTFVIISTVVIAIYAAALSIKEPESTKEAAPKTSVQQSHK